MGNTPRAERDLVTRAGVIEAEAAILNAYGKIAGALAEVRSHYLIMWFGEHEERAAAFTAAMRTRGAELLPELFLAAVSEPIWSEANQRRSYERIRREMEGQG